MFLGQPDILNRDERDHDLLIRDEYYRELLAAVAIMYDGKVIDLDRKIALIAAELSFELKLPMADSIILATARAYKAILWTQDEHYKDIEGVKYIKKKIRKQNLPAQWITSGCSKLGIPGNLVAWGCIYSK